MAQHVTYCRQHNEHLRNALAVIIPESNMGTVSLNLALAMKRDVRLPNCMFVMEDSSQKGGEKDLPGSITTKRNKQEMVTLLKTEYLQAGKICFHIPFMVSEVERSRVDNVQQEIVKQVRNFCKQRKQRHDHEGNLVTEIIYTGKPPVGSGDDDYVIALIMGPYHKKRFFLNPRNQPYWF